MSVPCTTLRILKFDFNKDISAVIKEKPTAILFRKTLETVINSPHVVNMYRLFMFVRNTIIRLGKRHLVASSTPSDHGQDSMRMSLMLRRTADERKGALKLMYTHGSFQILSRTSPN